MIRYAQPLLDDSDIAAVAAVLRTPDLTQGEAIGRFERSVADYCGVPHAIAVGSATAGLHLACLALGLQPGQRLWTTPITFVATANAARHCGAGVDFIDIDRHTRNLSVDALAARLEVAAREDRLPAIVAPVHFAGAPCAMAAIAALAQRYRFRIVEDAAHALGARSEGAPVGAARHADCCVFSFHAVKIATTGEGGVVTTRDDALAARLRLLRSHGISRDPALLGEAHDGPWSYAQLALGFNSRMTELQAALGASQMRRVDAFVARRRALAARYDALLAGLPLRRPPANGDSAWHLYVIELAADARLAVYERMHAHGIGVNVHYMPLYRHPYHRDAGAAAACPAAETYYAGALSLPLHAALSDAEQDAVVAALRAALA